MNKMFFKNIMNIIKIIKKEITKKQDIINGDPGQIISFDENKNLKAIDLSSVEGTELNHLTTEISTLNENLNELNTKLSDLQSRVGKSKFIIKRYASVEDSVILDCFPNDNLTYIMIGFISLDNAIERILFTSTIRNNSAAALNIVTEKRSTAYLELSQTSDLRLKVTLKNISGSAHINVQTFLIQFWS